MAKWEDALNDITNDPEAPATTTEQLPLGYVVMKEPKSRRRSFALQNSVVDALEEIAADQGVKLNALVNDVLLDYVNKYTGRD